MEQVQAHLSGARPIAAAAGAVLALGFALGAGLIRKSPAGLLSVTSAGRSVGRRSVGVDVLGESVLALEEYLTDREIAARHDVSAQAVRAARQRAAEAHRMASAAKPRALHVVPREGKAEASES